MFFTKIALTRRHGGLFRHFRMHIEAQLEPEASGSIPGPPRPPRAQLAGMVTVRFGTMFLIIAQVILYLYSNIYLGLPCLLNSVLGQGD